MSAIEVVSDRILEIEQLIETRKARIPNAKDVYEVRKINNVILMLKDLLEINKEAYKALDMMHRNYH